MPYYSFNMKKGKYRVEMTSDDIFFARRQVDKLFEKLLNTRGRLRVVLPEIEPVKEIEEPKKPEPPKTETPETVKDIPVENNSLQKTKPAELPKPKEEIKEEKPVKQVVKEEPTAELPVVEPDTEPEIEPVKTVEIKKEVPVEEPEITEEPELSLDMDESIIQQADEILQEEFEEEETEVPSPQSYEIAEEEIEEIEEEPQDNIFEKILAEKTIEVEKEQEEAEEEESVIEVPKAKKTFSFKKIISEKLKTSVPEKTKEEKTKNIQTKIIEPQNTIPVEEEDEEQKDEEIAKILEEKIKKNIPSQENKTVFASDPVKTAEEETSYEEQQPVDIRSQEFDSLGQLIALKNPQSKMDYLLLAAYYLQTKESLFKYSLKQLNSKIMPFLGSLIDHSVIHNAVAHDFIEVVPDYNGTAEVTEYRLTLTGENYLINEL